MSNFTDTQRLDWLQTHPHYRVCWLNGAFAVYDGPVDDEHTEVVATGRDLREAIDRAVNAPYLRGAV